MQRLRLGWLDIIAIMIVVFLFISIPLLVFLLVVSGYGIVSSLARYVTTSEWGEALNAASWLLALIILVVVLWWLVRWHRS
ncbi:MAG: hypothetical protein DRJ43_02395 [Thermoprotei archaeon]|nr:MAG: hypothetical protein DRJ43_02395 [Thermoprotei archaeon]